MTYIAYVKLDWSKMEKGFKGLIQMGNLLSEKEPLATIRILLSAPCSGRAPFHPLGAEQ